VNEGVHYCMCGFLVCQGPAGSVEAGTVSVLLPDAFEEHSAQYVKGSAPNPLNE
jgi:hypothetical protein